MEAEFDNSLAGFVYIDTDNDGVKDANEMGLSRVIVTLVGVDAGGNAVNRTLQTKDDGSYVFTNIPPGTYSIIETQPNFIIDGIDTIGTPGGDDSVNDQFSQIIVGATTQGVNNNFGERGRTAQFATLADFIMTREEVATMNTRFDDSVLSATSTTDGQVWSNPGAGWDDVISVNVYVSPDETQLAVTIVRDDGTTTITTLAINDPQERVTVLGRVDDTLVIRLNGTSASFPNNVT